MQNYEASHTTRVFKAGLNTLSTGAEHKDNFKASKAFYYGSSHSNFTSFLVSKVRGAAISLNLKTNRL